MIDADTKCATVQSLVAAKFKAEDAAPPGVLQVREVKSSSVQLVWALPETSYRIDGTRISVKKGRSPNFESVVVHSHEGNAKSYTVVNLADDSEYVFQVNFLHDKHNENGHPAPMVISGKNLISGPVRTRRANHFKAWFFENEYEIEREWATFLGRLNKPGQRGGLFTNEVAAPIDMRLTDAMRKPVACVTGRRCLELKVPGGVAGGCVIDVAVADARRYLAEVYVYHEPSTTHCANTDDSFTLNTVRTTPTSSYYDGEDSTTYSAASISSSSKRSTQCKQPPRARLAVWTYNVDGSLDPEPVVSQPTGVEVNGWERLQCEFEGTPSGKIKLAVECPTAFKGIILVDACRLLLLGRDRLGEAVHELENAVISPRCNKNGIIHVNILQGVNLPRNANLRPPTLPELACIEELDEELPGGLESRLAAATKSTKMHHSGGKSSQLRFVSRFLPLPIHSELGKTVESLHNENPYSDPARPVYVRNDSSCFVLNLRDHIRTAVRQKPLHELLHEPVLDIELQDTTVKGSSAAHRRKLLDTANEQEENACASPEMLNNIKSLDNMADPGMALLAQRQASVLGTELNSGQSGDGIESPTSIATKPSTFQGVQSRGTTPKMFSSFKARSSFAASAGLLSPGVSSSKRSMSRGSARIKDANEAAPVARLRMNVRELLLSSAYRSWYRLHDEHGATHSCLAVQIRTWDPEPRPDPNEDEEDDDIDSDDERLLDDAIGVLAARLAGDYNMGAEERRSLFAKLLRKLGASGAALAIKAGTGPPPTSSARTRSATPLKTKLLETARTLNLAADSLGRGSDRRDPVEAQSRIQPVQLVRLKTEMVRQGLLEECVASLHSQSSDDEAVVQAAAALLVAIVSFPSALAAGSADIARCSAALQRAARTTGVLSWIEESADAYSTELHGAGADSKLHVESAINSGGSEEQQQQHDGLPPPLTGSEKALLAQLTSAGAPSPAAPVGTAAAVLAAIFGGATRALAASLEASPALMLVLIRGAAEEIPIAKRCLEQLNLLHTFKAPLLDLYSEYRLLVPECEPRYWRCLSLEVDLNSSPEAVRQLVREARRRIRAADRHRRATGVYPRRIRIQSESASFRLNGAAAEFKRATGQNGGPAFFKNASSKKTDLIAVAFNLISDSLVAEFKRRRSSATAMAQGSLRHLTPVQREQAIAKRRKSSTYKSNQRRTSIVRRISFAKSSSKSDDALSPTGAHLSLRPDALLAASTTAPSSFFPSEGLYDHSSSALLRLSTSDDDDASLKIVEASQDDGRDLKTEDLK